MEYYVYILTNKTGTVVYVGLPETWSKEFPSIGKS